MACERFREALADVAAGAPARAGLEAHLATCEACRTELAALRQALAVADAEMAGLLSAEPPPELAVRIRRAVAETSERSPALAARIRRAVADWNGPSRQRGSVLEDEAVAWRRGWLWPATAAAATLLVALAVVLGRGTESTPGPRVAEDAARPGPAVPIVHGRAAGRLEPGPVIPRSTVSPGDEESAVPPADPSHVDAAARARGDRASVHSRSVDRRLIPAEPEVLVPPGEAEALLRFVALVHRERLAPPALAAAGQPSADLAELASIDIQPLEIVPLDPAETSGT